MRVEAWASPQSRNEALFARAKGVLVGGVSSPVRSFSAVGGPPRFIRHASGAELTDEEGRTYLDFVLSWGAVILGHAHPAVVTAVHEAAARGTTYGAPTEAEVALAEAIRKDMGSVERLRFVNSGTEAAMSALRVARGFTGRDRVVMFEGCYHGHADPFLAKAGSGVAAAGLPKSAGVPAGAARDTIVLPFNDEAALEGAFKEAGETIAAAIVEPIPANMGVVLPRPGFLRRLREVCDEQGSLLVFDEVVTGYRVGRGGAQGLLKIEPDLTCLGKVVGGGLPAAAFGGRREVMEKLAPLGPVYQAGTLAGNPLAMAAGLATLRELTPAAYERLEASGSRLEDALQKTAATVAVPLITARAGAMVGFHLSRGPVSNFRDASRQDGAAYAKLFHELLSRGVYFPPSPFEALFLSLAHDRKALDRAEAAIAAAFEVVGA
jgi:glutamate-1-semialdehyde 2,1-aminomutase